MFLEAIVAGRPDADGAPVDITTGLRRYRRDAPDPLHWQLDPRFGHFARCDRGIAVAAEKRKSFQEELTSLNSKEAVADAISAALIRRLQTLLGLPDGAIGRDSSLTDLGIDSITANAVRNWFIDLVGNQFALIQILDAPSIKKFSSSFVTPSITPPSI
ncbi:hypothetical protein NUW58_g9334 [Xylaria curta]|uniref:Uncharacterized protein n=1 Tax=Xylaria curta TaxID=42375 RepID=A0ACC1MZC2_9PEZI|nr:hypothetical protein NUW58_g9334 [Xylaria curta]